MCYKFLKPSLFLLVPVLLFCACANPAKLMEKGRYEEAISLSIKKLSGKKNKKMKYVKALEASFARMTNLDIREIAVLEKEKKEENWVAINQIHQRIRFRQHLIEPLLPLYADDGYKADFKFVRIEDLEIKSKEKAAEYYYGEGRRKLAEAKQHNDKPLAREAHSDFERIGQYYKSFKDEDQYKKQAKELGMVYVLFKMENDSRSLLPKDFEKEIKRISVKELDSDWRTVHLNPDRAGEYDYTVVMRLTDIDVTADYVKEREYVDDKTIEEGWEYVLDSKGNVVKDSLGNDLKVPKKVLIKARVFENYQQKAAHVGGRLEFFDRREKEIIHTEPLAVDAMFENYAATFDGDKRALTEESKRKIGNRPVPFPSSERLILQAADLLKPVVKDKIASSRILI